jgi:hypothetical protein
MPQAAIHDFFKQIRLQDANQSGAVDQTLVADSTTDTLKITTHGGVIFESPSIATDSFGLNVDYSVNVPIGTTALTLTDIISNTTNVNFTGGPGVTVVRNSANELEIGLEEGYTAIKKFAIGADDSTLRFLDDGESALFLGSGGIATSSDVEGNITIDGSAFLQAEVNDLTSAVTWANVPDANITQSSVTQHQAALSITESQISDLQSYLTSETNDLTAAVTWANVPDANITQSSVTQHQAALSITESQISDLQSYLTAETNDLTAAVTWANVPDANITQSSVTQHQAALSITESQISDLQSYLTAEVNDLTSAVTWANVPDANITQSSVTQHQAALSITESQISDLQSYLTAETNDLTAAVTWANVPDANITQSSVTQHQAALSITESQISDLQSYLTSYTETDPVVGAVTGIVKADGAGNISAAVAGTDYLVSETITLATLKAEVAASTDFADFQSRIAAL